LHYGLIMRGLVYMVGPIIGAVTHGFNWPALFIAGVGLAMFLPGVFELEPVSEFGTFRARWGVSLGRDTRAEVRRLHLPFVTTHTRAQRWRMRGAIRVSQSDLNGVCGWSDPWDCVEKAAPGNVDCCS
jgi:hypothetical protein